MQLLRGADPLKDQSYFLASVQPHALQRVLFPVGEMCKGAVRQLAGEKGLPPAERRSSAGICFIGGGWALLSAACTACAILCAGKVLGLHCGGFACWRGLSWQALGDAAPAPQLSAL